MGVRQYRTFVGDFETTVYKNQTSTEVWASAVVELGTEEVFIHHSIQETFMFLTSMKTNVRIKLLFMGWAVIRFWENNIKKYR